MSTSTDASVDSPASVFEAINALEGTGLSGDAAGVERLRALALTVAKASALAERVPSRDERHRANQLCDEASEELKRAMAEAINLAEVRRAESPRKRQIRQALDASRHRLQIAPRVRRGKHRPMRRRTRAAHVGAACRSSSDDPDGGGGDDDPPSPALCVGAGRFRLRGTVGGAS